MTDVSPDAIPDHQPAQPLGEPGSATPEEPQDERALRSTLATVVAVPFAAILAVTLRIASRQLGLAAAEDGVRWLYTSALIVSLLIFCLTFGLIVYRLLERRTPSAAAIATPIVITIAWLLLSGPWQAFEAETRRAAREWALTTEYGDLPDRTIAASAMPLQRCAGISVTFENGEARPFEGRAGLPVDGHDRFIGDMQVVLNEIATYAPARYEELLEYLPQATYERGWIRRYYGSNVLALSNGYFAIDASDHGQALFTETVLHELGHNVLAYRVDEYREDRYSDDDIDILVEEDADRYAAVVMSEMNACRAATR